jgi:dihydroxyacetone kinase
LVGKGLAHGAAMGNLFASPSMQRVTSVCTAVENGGGVLLTYGNYAGDVLNFTAAQDRLINDGIACRTVVVTDDVASSPIDMASKRRGIAGDLAVFRIAAAAAEEGLNLDQVTGLAQKANARCRSFGLAFSGCSFPGATEPLFTVEDGQMAVGLGIHGEPGIGQIPIPSANGVASMLVTRLLEEIPAGAEMKVIPILNGLGSVKYEELFVVYREIARLLGEAGVQIMDPHVGEYCTSFDMAGLSLTLFWPDDQLWTLWDRDVYSASYRRTSTQSVDGSVEDEAFVENRSWPPAAEASQSAARIVVGALACMADVIDKNVDELGRLDSIAGDGDHGIGMQRGVGAALFAAERAERAGAGARSTLEYAADAWSDVAGGTSGALWGVILLRIAQSMSDTVAPEALDFSRGVRFASNAVQEYGRATVGDKTMVDALEPFAKEFEQALQDHKDLSEALEQAAEVAERSANGTAEMLPKLGRAKIHGEKSLGVPDPGAWSFSLIARALARFAHERSLNG